MRVSSKLPTIQRKIDSLESAGFKIRLHHNSQKSGYIPGNPEPLEFKGVTAIDIDNGEGVGVYGEALCSVRDQFDRSVGTEIAFQHAMSQLHDVLGRDGMKNIFKGKD